MKFHQFSKFNPEDNQKTGFEKLLDIFMQLLTYTSGDVAEALSWLTELDKQYQLTSDEYGMGDFIEDLKDKGYIDDKNPGGEIKITPKAEQTIRKRSLEEIFGTVEEGAVDAVDERRELVVAHRLDQLGETAQATLRIEAGHELARGSDVQSRARKVHLRAGGVDPAIGVEVLDVLVGAISEERRRRARAQGERTQRSCDCLQKF